MSDNAQPTRSWYAINAKAGSDEAEILIYDEIGYWGITAKQFVSELRRIDAKTITLRINSPGGDVIDGTAIYNALRAHGATIKVRIEGMALSAGSFIAMAGDSIEMANNAYMMIHNAWSIVAGEAEDMRASADLLDKMNDNIAGMYEAKAGKDRNHWRGLMDAETWFTGEEAKTEGLVDLVYEPTARAAARAGAKSFKAYNKVPDAVRAMLTATQDNQSPLAPSRDGANSAVSHTETPPMADPVPTTQATAPAAEPTAPKQGKAADLSPLRAQEIQGYVEQGRAAGQAEGRTAEQARCKAIMEACPGKPQMALNAFMSGQTPEAVKLAFEAAAAAEQAAEQRIAELQEENRRQVALAAAGGYVGGVGMPLALDAGENDGPVTPEAAKAAAEREWDRNPSVRKGFSAKANYVNVRAAELRGQFGGRKQTA